MDESISSFDGGGSSATCVLVAGSPRCGSAMARRALLAAGLPLPDRRCRCQPGARCHCPLDGSLGTSFEAALRARGAAWDRPPTTFDARSAHLVLRALSRLERDMTSPWGIRDVRATLFVDALLPRRHVHVVGVYRDPAACVASLLRREADRLVRADRPSVSMLRFWRAPGDALKLWTHYNRCLLDAHAIAPGQTTLVAHEALRAGLSLAELVNREAGLALDVTRADGILVDPVPGARRPAWTVPLERTKTNRAERLLAALDDATPVEARHPQGGIHERLATPAMPIAHPAWPTSADVASTAARSDPIGSIGSVGSRSHRVALEAVVQSLPTDDARARLRLALSRSLDRLSAETVTRRRAA